MFAVFNLAISRRSSCTLWRNSSIVVATVRFYTRGVRAVHKTEHLSAVFGSITPVTPRSGRSIWLEIKSDNVEEMSRKILESGVVEKLHIPDPHLYFQAPGGQCLRLVGINQDLSKYEGVGESPNAERAKEAVKRL